MKAKQKTAERLLDYLNTTYAELHGTYEKLFWISAMGDHSVDRRMNKAMADRDVFRADASLQAEVRGYLKTKLSESAKDRLELWNNFFSLYQAPPRAAKIKSKLVDLESALLRKRAKRKEGYTDPATKKFVGASENKMRALMRTHADEAVRKACFDALEKLPLAFLDDFIKILNLRNEFARALGHEDFYAYKARIDEDMTKKQLFNIFDKIYEKTKYGFKGVRDLEKTRPGLRKPWNFGYMMAGSFVKAEEPYFQFENVLSYWGRSFAALGIGFMGGTVQLDLLDRKGKWNNGFCHYPSIVRYKKGKRLPASSNFASTAIPGQLGSGSQGIHTVFHEGGHAADRLNSLETEACVNTEYPPSTVSWAETHSMFMDTISSSIEWRVRYAKDAKGRAYPFSLFEKKVKALHPLRPLSFMHMAFVVNFEREVYECKHLTRDFILKTARRNFKKYFDRSEDSISVLNIPHIYNWENSAYYHGYGLAELTVEQWRQYFFNKYGYIVDNPKVGKEMTKIWSYASRYPAKKLVEMATGKKLSPDAYIRSITSTVEAIMNSAKNRLKRMKKVPLFTKPVDLHGRIIMLHGKKKIADNSKSFEDMDKKYRKWLETMKE